MVDNQVNTARQLSFSGMKNLKCFIHIEIAGPQGSRGPPLSSLSRADLFLVLVVSMVCISLYLGGLYWLVFVLACISIGFYWRIFVSAFMVCIN